MADVTVRYQRRWRLADDKDKSVAEGFTSIAKAQQWAEENGHSVTPREKRLR